MFKRTILSFGIVTAAFVFSFLLISQTRTNDSNVLSTTDPAAVCANGSNIVHPGNDFELNGFVNIEANVSQFYPNGTGNPDELTYVKFKSTTGQQLGFATQLSGATSIWRLENWDSALTDNGNFEIYGILNYGNGAVVCSTDIVSVVVNNSTSSTTQETDYELRVFIAPQSWSSLTYEDGPLMARAKLYDVVSNQLVEDVTAQTIFEWSNNVGQIIRPYWSDAIFNSGPKADNGFIKVRAQYSNYEDEKSISVNVFRNNSETAYTDTGTSGSGDNNYTSNSGQGTYSGTAEAAFYEENGESFLVAIDDDLTDNEVDKDVSQIIKEKRQVSTCVLNRIGDREYNNLITSGSRFSADQIQKSHSCFITRSFVIPPSLAPVDPTAVTDLLVTEEAAIDELRNIEKIVSNEKFDVLELSGYAEPNEVVLIYIYSEPLVLSTKTDSTGRWVYTLEEPLEPGEHEAYIMVESDTVEGEFVRSGLFSFAVTNSDVSPNNPNGYSLTLAEDNYTLLTYYIIGAAMLVLVAAMFLTKYLWFKAPDDSDDTDQATASS